MKASLHRHSSHLAPTLKYLHNTTVTQVFSSLISIRVALIVNYVFEGTLQGLGMCEQLQILHLQSNVLYLTVGLDKCRNLWHLDLSNNHVSFCFYTVQQLCYTSWCDTHGFTY